VALSWACASPKEGGASSATSDAKAATSSANPVSFGVSTIDKSVAPGDDFFSYANGLWIKSTEIPADHAAWNDFTILAELTARRTADLITEAAKSAPEGSDARKVGDYYASFLDEATIEAKGITPLKPTLDAIAAISNRKDLSRVIGGTLRADVDVLNATNYDTDNLFGLWVAQDLDDPSHYSPFLLQGGLGMPNSDYYTDPSPKMAEIRAQYSAHVVKMLVLAGNAEADAKVKAQRIIELETKIARVHVPLTDTEDPLKGNNHWKRAELDKRAPGIDWNAFFTGAGFQPDVLVIWQPTAFTGISALVRDVPLETWKDYLAYHAITRVSSVLPKAFDEENFAFYGKVLTGTPQLRERWKRGVDATSGALGEVVGKLYVERYFPASEKARAEEMVRNEIAAFGRRIDALTWMAPQTKVQAKAKLAALKVGIGYPDHWRDYSGLQVVRGDALGNHQRVELFEYRRNLAKLSQPVDRGEWVMNAHEINAVNLPAMNALNFPAGMLQPPYFDPTRPMAMDYGSIGAIIGHEISHSFDNLGALFNAEGRLHNWWTDEDFAHFKASGAQLVKQYDAYQPFPDVHVNGQQTLGENIADVAGLSAAYDAYRLAQGNKEPAPVQGFSSDQQFFLSYAWSWRDKMREPMLRQLLVANEHAPSAYRSQTVRNLDAWYTAFGVKPGQKLFLAPEARVRVW
jgi:predicted metalloendopeptidase